jgi:HlyD family secretion protein
MKSKIDPESDVAKTLGVDRASGRGTRLKRWLLVVLLVVVAVAALKIARRRSEKSQTMQYKTREVARGDLTVIVSATGTLEPTNEVEVGSELSGIIKSVDVDYNDRVKVNQVLARLDTSKLEAQVTQSRAALESAKAKVLQAQASVRETRSKLSQLQRVRELSNNKVPSQSEFDAADAAFERAKADEASAHAAVSQAGATLEAIETDLSKALIRSPVNGVVLTRSVEPGQTVAASFQAPVLFTLAEDLTKMELHVDVDEADVGQVKNGQRATFHVDAYPDRTFQARITQVRYGSQTVENVVTYETVLKVDNSDLSLRPGMTATADITVKRVEDAVLITNAALRFAPPVEEEKESSRGLVGMLLPRPPRSMSSKQPKGANNDSNQRRVWVLKDGKPVEVPITAGATDGVMTEVLKGDIRPGMELVLEIVSAKK